MAYDLTQVGNVIARSMVGYMTISLVAVGIQLFMCIYGLTVFLETPHATRKGRVPYIVVTFLLFGLFTLSATLDVNYLFRILFYSTSPKNFMVLREESNDWSGVLSQTSNYVVNFLGDALLLYRCYVIWYDRRWIVLAPGMTYIVSVVFGILSLLPMTKDISKGDTNLTYGSLFIFMSVAMNILVTLLITFRLVQARRHFTELIPSGNFKMYTGVVAILIESALPLSIFGLGYAIILAVTKSGDPDLLQKEVANYVFTGLYFSFAALSPQMIIFRVTTGRSWVANPHGSPGSAISNGIAFAPNSDEERSNFNPSGSSPGDSDAELQYRAEKPEV